MSGVSFCGKITGEMDSDLDASIISFVASETEKRHVRARRDRARRERAPSSKMSATTLLQPAGVSSVFDGPSKTDQGGSISPGPKKKSKTSAKPKPTKPVCLRTFEMRFFERNPDKMRFSPEYKSAVAEHEALMTRYRIEQQEWAMEAVENDQDIPYEQRSTASLERECDARGILSTGKRDILLQRLLRHDVDKTDKTVTTASMVVLEKTVPVTFFMDPQAPVAFYADAAKIAEFGILALPHDIIRRHLLKFFDEATEYRSLKSLLLTCKYLHADVTTILLERAKQRFGPGGTLQALGALDFICNSRTNLDFMFKDTFFFSGAMQSTFDVRGCMISTTWDDSPLIVGMRILRACITKYGSIEGFRAHKAKQKQLAINKQLDQQVLNAGRQERFNNLISALEKRGYPQLFELVETDPDRKRSHCLISVNSYGDYQQDSYQEFHQQVYGQDHWKKAFAKTCSHVQRANPETLKAVLKYWPDSQAKRYAEWKLQERSDSVMCVLDE